MLTLLTNINDIKFFLKKNKIWNPSPVQRLVIVGTPPAQLVLAVV